MRSWPKKWNDTGLRDIAILPESPSSGPWPLLGMLALGLVAGAALGGYAVSHRRHIKKLAKRAHRMGDRLDAMDAMDAMDKGESASADSSATSNHRRKAISEV